MIDRNMLCVLTISGGRIISNIQNYILEAYEMMQHQKAL